MPELRLEWLPRVTAGALVLAAGALHLAQIGPHSDEDPLFGLFFLVVGVLQIVGGLYLLRPLGPGALVRSVAYVGIGGSLLTIAIWLVSRTAGLPFGSEPGTPETVGLADAASGLFEALTALLLLVWLRREFVPIAAGAGALVSLGLAALWIVLRTGGRFAPDPRLVTDSGLTDVAAVAFLVVAATLLRSLTLLRGGTGARIGYALLLALLVSSSSLVVFTLPARGGQNRDCAYAPIREDSGLSHAQAPEPIRLEVGERTSVVALLLVACADAPVALRDVRPIEPLADTAEIAAITIDRSRSASSDRVRARGGGIPAIGATLEPGQGRYPLVLEIHALRPGAFFVSALRIDYEYRDSADYTGFASFVFVCVGDEPCPRPPAH